MAPQPHTVTVTDDLGLPCTSTDVQLGPVPHPSQTVVPTSVGTYKWLWFAVSIAIVVGFAFTNDPKKINPDTVVPESFRLGSGAVGSVHTVPNMHVEHATTEDGPEVDAIARKLRGTNTAAIATQNLHLRHFMYGALVAVILSVTVQMVPARDGRDVNYRVPPSWNPENDHSYSFRAYMTDVSLWIMLTDLQPHQQCAALISRLGGAAREMGRMITPPEIMQGGVRNGVQLDPATYLLAALQDRFAALDEETRLSSMTELMAFHRHPGESINALLSRYEIVRQRAATEGQFVMSVEGCALQILRACNINPHQIILLLHPFGGRMPNNEAEFSQLCTALRRMGRIMEGVPGNVSTLLRGPMREARPGAYVAE